MNTKCVNVLVSNTKDEMTKKIKKLHYHTKEYKVEVKRVKSRVGKGYFYTGEVYHKE